jgi:hypothetical protein
MNLTKCQEDVILYISTKHLGGEDMLNIKAVDAYEINTADGSMNDRVCFECASEWIKSLTGETFVYGEPFEKDGVQASWHWPEGEECTPCWCGAPLEL